MQLRAANTAVRVNVTRLFTVSRFVSRFLRFSINTSRNGFQVLRSGADDPVCLSFSQSGKLHGFGQRKSALRSRPAGLDTAGGSCYNICRKLRDERKEYRRSNGQRGCAVGWKHTCGGVREVRPGARGHRRPRFAHVTGI